MKPGDTLRIMKIALQPSLEGVEGCKAKLLCSLQSPLADFHYLRVKLLSGSHIGEEVSILCKARVIASDLCTCNKYPFPHSPHGIEKLS